MASQFKPLAISGEELFELLWIQSAIAAQSIIIRYDEYLWEIPIESVSTKILKANCINSINDEIGKSFNSSTAFADFLVDVNTGINPCSEVC